VESARLGLDAGEPQVWSGDIAGEPARFSAFTLQTESGPRRRDFAAFEKYVGIKEGHWYVFLVTDTAGEAREDRRSPPEMERVLERCGFQVRKTGDKQVWYDDRFDWDAPLAFNAWFSIGSSLAFVAVMLLFGFWRLSRIDF
jgi:hypothetical protein